MGLQSSKLCIGSCSSELAKTISRHSSLEQADADMEGMSAICPLDDEYLPIDAGSLKIKQVRPPHDLQSEESPGIIATLPL